MMPSTQGDEIREIGLSPLHPVDHVMDFCEVDKTATSKPATLVAARDLDSLS
jgi:hypothetical protein